MNSFTKKEKILMQKLNTPAKVQDFLNGLRFNFEEKGETLKSPIIVLKTKSAHCIEGAILGAYILSLHGFPPLVLHLEATKSDFDHVLAPFKQHELWGALSKTNHAVLRYREPVYKSIHELVMSYFHEYFTNHNGRKTLRSYSMPIDLSRFDKQGWMTAEEDVWYIPEYLFEVQHQPILSRSQIAMLRKADSIEIQAGSITEWKKK